MPQQTFEEIHQGVVEIDDAASRGDPPDIQQGVDAVGALRAILDWVAANADAAPRGVIASLINKAWGLS